MILYKFRPFDRLEWIADILLQQRLFCAKYSELNDPFEGECNVVGTIDFKEGQSERYISATSLDDVRDLADLADERVCSLSSNWRDVRMWSHYGGGHRGVAIEINFDRYDHTLHRVSYHQGLRRYDEDAAEFPSATTILTSKSALWSHEEEVRILGNNEFISVNGRIRRVLLGARCGRFEENAIRRLAHSIEVVPTKLNHIECCVEGG